MIEPLEIAALLEKFAPADVSKPAALKAAIRRGVTERLLMPNDELPSTRKAAAALSMSRNSVIEAYEGLQAEGVVTIRRGARPRICELPELQPRRPVRHSAIALSSRGRALSTDHRDGYVVGHVNAFAPGLPDPNLFPRDEWAVCVRRTARRDQRGVDHYEDYQGVPALRRAIALHLKKVRGVAVSPDQIFVLPNTQSGLTLMSDLLTDPDDCVLMEDPGYAGAKALFEAKRLRIHPLPERLSPRDTPVQSKLIYVTPSTQFPTGQRMQLRRRLDILACAERQNALVLEDDYDGDFVWRGADVPPVFALDKTASVALLGTLSKSVMPGMRLGWLIVPPQLVDAVKRAQKTMGLSVNTQVQSGMAEFMATGHFARHLRAAARTYHARMLLLTDALRDRLGNHVDVSMPDGGLQVLLRFGPDIDDRAVEQRLWSMGYHVIALSRLCLARDDRGVVIGFARANSKNTAKFAAALSGVLRRL